MQAPEVSRKMMATLSLFLQLLVFYQGLKCSFTQFALFHANQLHSERKYERRRDTWKEIIQMLVTVRYAKILNNLPTAVNDGMQQDCRSVDKYTDKTTTCYVPSQFPPKNTQTNPKPNNSSPHFCCNGSRAVPV